MLPPRIKLWLKIATAAWLWHCATLWCAAQPERLFVHQLTTQDGLPESYAAFVHRDAAGIVWLSTSGGTSWHDGQGIRPIPAPHIDGQGASSEFWEDTAHGLVWFSTRQALNCYRRQQHDFVQITFPEPLRDCNLIFFEQTSGMLWVAANGKIWRVIPSGLRSEPEKYRLQTIGAKPEGTACPVVDEQGRLRKLVFTDESQPQSGIRTFNLLEGELRQGQTFPFDIIVSVLPESESRLWVATRNGLALFDLVTGKTLFSDPSPGCVMDIVHFDAQHLLLATLSQGICLYNTRLRRAERFYAHDPTDPHSIAANMVFGLYLDPDTTLWVSTFSGLGFANLKKGKFDFVSKSALDPDFLPKSIAPTPDGNILLGTDFVGKLYQYAPDGRVRKTSAPFHVSLICPLPNERYLLSVSPESTDKGLGSCCYDRRSGKFVPIRSEDGRSPALTAMCRLRDGRILAGDATGLYTLRESASGWLAELVQSDLNDISLLAEDSAGHAWVAYQGRYLAVLEDFTWRVTRQYQLEGYAKTFAETPRHWWLGGEFGLARIEKAKPDSLRFFRTQHGLPNNKVYGILADARGDLWFSTNKGIGYHRVGDESFHSFSLADGLQGLEYNGHSFCRDAAGNFWFGGMGGLNRFRPDSVLARFSRKAPLLRLNALLINHRPYRQVLKSAPANPNDLTQTALQLAHDENVLEFAFSAVEFRDPASQVIYYQLTPSDEPPNENNWAQVPGAFANIRFEQLLPGKYKLHLHVANSDGVRFNLLAMEIFISAPFYQQPWFVLAVGLFALLVSYLFARYQFRKQLRWNQLLLLEKDFEIQKLRALDLEKKRIADEMHDDLGGVLTTIVKILEKLVENPQYAAISQPMRAVAEKADTAMKNMRHIIWALEGDNDTLAATLAYIVENAGKFLQEHQINLEAGMLTQVPKAALTGGQRRRTFLAVQEALHNAVKFSRTEKVLLSVEVVDKAVKISIRDYGIGIAANATPGRGTNTLRENMEAIGGSALRQDTGNGVEVLLQFPIKPEPAD